MRLSTAFAIEIFAAVFCQLSSVNAAKRTKGIKKEKLKEAKLCSGQISALTKTLSGVKHPR